MSSFLTWQDPQEIQHCRLNMVNQHLKNAIFRLNADEIHHLCSLSPHEIPHFCCSESSCPSGDDRCSSRELAAFIKKTGSSPWPRTQHGTACRAMFLDVSHTPATRHFLLSCHMGGVGWGNNVHVHLRRIGCMMIFSCTCKILQTHTERLDATMDGCEILQLKTLVNIPLNIGFQPSFWCCRISKRHNR